MGERKREERVGKLFEECAIEGSRGKTECVARQPSAAQIRFLPGAIGDVACT